MSLKVCFHRFLPPPYLIKIYLFNYFFFADTISTIAENGYSIPGVLSGPFQSIISIAIDWINSPSNIYVLDFVNCFYIINQTSSDISTFAGTCYSPGFQDGPLLSALFNMPQSIRYLSSSSGTKLLVADGGNNAIRMIDISSGLCLQTKRKWKRKYF